jgi:hypothetical protein
VKDKGRVLLTISALSKLYVLFPDKRRPARFEYRLASDDRNKLLETALDSAKQLVSLLKLLSWATSGSAGSPDPGLRCCSLLYNDCGLFK